jgi:hypothetical protein
MQPTIVKLAGISQNKLASGECVQIINLDVGETLLQCAVDMYEYNCNDKHILKGNNEKIDADKSILCTIQPTYNRNPMCRPF